jgi:hypothetical protein
VSIRLNRTSGAFATEEHALVAFDDVVERSSLFRLYREVEGYYMTHRPGRDLSHPRIDRILVPNSRLREQGWVATVGVEAKRSGSKLGPLVCQALDYSWAIYDIGNTYLHPEAIFLWPLDKDGLEGESIGHAIESVMTQNRIGYVRPTPKDNGVQFGLGGCWVLSFGDSGVVARRDIFDRVGRKVGSR